MIDEKRLFYLKRELCEKIQSAALFGMTNTSSNSSDFADLIDELIVMRIKQALEPVAPPKERTN